MFKYIFELKNRFFLIFLSFFSIFCAGFFYKETLLFIITEPCLNNEGADKTFYFIFTNVTEVFSAYVMLAFFLSIQIFLAFFVYHLFIFLSSAFFKSEYLFIKQIIFISFISWQMSALIVHFLIVPISWNFFSSFESFTSGDFLNLYFESKLNEYLFFYFEFYYKFIIYSQMFFISIVAVTYNNLTIELAQKFRKFYYYIFLILSTLISPPDVVSQFFYGILFILLYEFLIFSLSIKKSWTTYL